MKRETYEGIEIIVLEGRIDQDGAEELEALLQACLNEGKFNICIDMLNVKHICSSALGSLVSIKRKLKSEEGDMKLIVLSENLMRLFQTTMLDKVFEIYDSRRECFSTFDV